MISELLPGLGSVVDDIALIRSMWTDQFNHAAGRTALAHRQPAFRQRVDGLVDHLRPGLREPEPARFRRPGQRRTAIRAAGKSVWGSGFLPSVYQGVQCRTSGDPILYVRDPAGMSRDVRRRSLDALRR